MLPQSIGTALVALAGVLLLILLVAQGLRRFGLAPAATARGDRRLAVIETVALDSRRRLVLLRCDGRELLLLTGGPQDLVLPAAEERR